MGIPHTYVINHDNIDKALKLWYKGTGFVCTLAVPGSLSDYCDHYMEVLTAELIAGCTPRFGFTLAYSEPVDCTNENHNNRVTYTP